MSESMRVTLGQFHQPTNETLALARQIGCSGGSFDGFRRGMELVPSPNVGLNFCMGNVDIADTMLALRRTGFARFVIEAHPPGIIDGTKWGHRGRAHSTGYIQGMLKVIEKLAP